MVSAYHGRDTTADEVRNLAGVPYGDLSILALSRAAEQLGFRTLSLKLSSDELNDQIQFPAIAHTQGQHYVVVERMTSRHVFIADPAYGQYRLPMATFQRRWMDQGQGVLLVMEPSASFEIRNDDQAVEEPVAFQMDFVAPDGWTWAQFLLEALILISFLQLFRAMIRLEVDDGGPELLIFGSVVLLTFSALVLLHYRWIAWKRSMIVYPHGHPFSTLSASSDGISDLTMTHPGSSWLALHVSGEWYSRAASQILDQYRAGVNLMFLSLYLVWVDPLAGLLFLASGMVLWLVFRLTSRQALGRMVISLEAEILGAQGLDGSEPDSSGRAYRPAGHWPGQQTWMWTIGMIRLIGLFWLILVMLGHWYVSASEVTNGLFVICAVVGFELLYIFLRGQRARLINRMWLPGFERANTVGLGEKNNMIEGSLVLAMPIFHPEGSSSLEEIVRLPARQSSLVFGADHPYKLQIFNQLVGLTSGEDARLVFDGQGLDPDGLRQWEVTRMMVHRSDRLPGGTIGEVITGRVDFEEDDPLLKDALAACLLMEPVQALPDGLHSIIGFGGWQVLSLTHQILAARALYQRPAWLFLDDVFSYLEPFREQVLLENVLQSRHGLATVVFSRKMELAGVVDWIVHVRDGHVLEQGSFAQLMESEGYFYSLITSS